MNKHSLPLSLMLLLGLSAGVTSGCATAPANPNLDLQSDSQISATVDGNTQNKKIYDGFMNIMDVSGTLENSRVGLALLDQKAKIYQWSADDYNNERSKMQSEQASATTLFMSFFVPERKWDNLHKADTKWKLFLDVNGKRYEGKAKRWKADISEVRSLFPHHSRWSTPYNVTFPVSTTEIENYPAKLTITGPAGNMQLDFAPVTLN